MLLRTEVDRVTGQLSDTRTRFLGARAPKVRAHNALPPPRQCVGRGWDSGGQHFEWPQSV